MGQIVYRGYNPGDEPQIVALWNRTLLRDPATARRFRHLVLLDANFDPEGMRLAFDEAGKLIGCVYAVRRLLPMSGTELEPDHGWIPFFFVDPEAERQGIASRLLKEAETFLRGQGRKKVFFASYAPNYIVPGIDAAGYPKGAAFLLKSGFAVQYSAVAMDYSLVDHETPEEVVALKRQREGEGYTFQTAGDGDLVELIRFNLDCFNPDWARAIREGILQGLPLERILVARERGRLVGFCMHGGYEGVRERFGPFGVHPDQRGQGIGKILLHDCLRSMRAQALHGAWFLWTGEQSPAGYLYKQAGFSITRSFDIMVKDLA
ncbi:GNAT family N-acetyltransferase [Paenibacillus macerans]|uniref:GNAT family N-acetyltransferase n=1 Tax=Paenibacillus macerans TaxID=44252 RepID=UPI003D31E530